MPPFSTLRLTLLRACYAVLVVGTSLRYAPVYMDGLSNLPRMDGAVVALLSALGVLSVAGLFSPIRMLPLLVFEIGWKLIRVSTVALPKWLDGALDEGTLSTLFNCAVALPFVFIVPWRHVASTVLGKAEPFRGTASTQGSAT
ncbi:hypothetical protein [Devosia sp.]|uniref:hypothetical protein n=1 Tax=Devosia sp. TaxID=1871048 RepID=UPI001ACC75E0|nr:hypothetical protein [Devosia sp.]MBN9308762.1 hypothetical protein [Devosia sp.]